MNHRRTIGLAWALAFGGGAVFLANHLLRVAMGAGTGGHEVSFWVVQVAALAAVTGCAAVGGGLAVGARWGSLGMRVLGPLVLLYLFAYNVFGGERPWWLGAGALVLTALVAVSVFLAYKSPTKVPPNPSFKRTPDGAA
ncbi:hypothetical protein Mpe_A0379 [Methylibium petroleiphilum PM1]|uniref:Transmembrane protein n=1 Tax=Methylibium petroleiphilum (strain ATCC BAA-1232 / LMG 22953 / PM1) TaxID=420662 RepID=A2SCQ2_METPP|nr:hypothetical protein Mpe_A0379 [Methylibium petroleiphilum PM1]